VMRVGDGRSTSHRSTVTTRSHPALEPMCRAPRHSGRRDGHGAGGRAPRDLRCNEALVGIPSEAEFTICKPMVGWQIELLTTLDEIAYAVSAYLLGRGKRPGIAMQTSTWQILGALVSN
jgi:hypothetical protein